MTRTIARKELLDRTMSEAIHLYARTVRRSFLCGKDPVSGNDYEYRKGLDRRANPILGGNRCDHCIGLGVMPNHYHTILRTHPERVQGWDDIEIAERRTRLFPRREAEGEPIPLSQEELKHWILDQDRSVVIRGRLADLSWFMRCLNEWIARKADKEDSCSVRFGKEDLSVRNWSMRPRC